MPDSVAVVFRELPFCYHRPYRSSNLQDHRSNRQRLNPDLRRTNSRSHSYIVSHADRQRTDFTLDTTVLEDTAQLYSRVCT